MSLPIKFLVILALACLFGGTAILSLAQSPKNNLPGYVYSDDGQPVSGAIVRVIATTQTTATAPDGSFSLPLLNLTPPFTVTAWSAGHYVGFTTATSLEPVSITMKTHYTTDNVDYNWFTFEGVEGSASCAICHPANAEWELDAHAQAALNPRFLSLYAGTNADGEKGLPTRRTTSGGVVPNRDGPDVGPGYKLDFPTRAGNCAACHAPLAAKEANTSNCAWSGCHSSVTAQFSDVVADGISPLYLTGNAAEGITCDFCHKIGEVHLDDETNLPHADMPGILSMRLYRPEEGDQLFFGPYDDVPRRDTYLPLQEESAFCAGCHYGIFSGVVGHGHVTGGVSVYNSYGEWLASSYSNPETGQTCQDCHMPVLDAEYYVFPEKGGMPRSHKPPHNHQMPGAADETLLQNSVTMTSTAQYQGDALRVDVSIINDQTGHYVPTGVPLRHVMLVVQATDAKGKPLALKSGPILPDWTGDYAGQPGYYYAKIIKDDWTGEAPTAAFWREISLVEDTRLVPFELSKNQFVFDAPANGPINVETQLVYRRAYQDLMEQKGWDTPDIVMEEASLVVEQP